MHVAQVVGRVDRREDSLERFRLGQLILSSNKKFLFFSLFCIRICVICLT